MSLPVISTTPFNINTSGIVPFVCEDWEGKPLFIIKGGISGSMLPTVYGEAYKYENFPWPEGKKVTIETCRQMAEKNNSDNDRLWVSDELCAQFKKIIGNKE